MARYWYGIGAVSCGLTLVTIVGVILVVRRPEFADLPNPDEVATMTATLFTDTLFVGHEVPEFAIPPKYVGRVLNMFQPGLEAELPPFLDRERFGRLSIHLKEGRTLALTFYFIGKNPLCFTVDDKKYMRYGPFDAVVVGDHAYEPIWIDEGLILTRIIEDLYEEKTTGREMDGYVEELFEDLERSAGRRPPRCR